MKKINWRLFAGGALVLVGLLTLLETLNIFPLTSVLWGVVFGIAGIGFLSVLFNDRSNWWAVIPGVVLLSLSALVIVEELFPKISGDVGGVIFLGGTAIAFWLVYSMNRQHWWAIIPGGVFTALTGTVLLDEFTRLDGGIFFLFGLAVTFALVALLPGLPGNRNWPWIPSGILFVVSLLALFSSLQWTSFLWAVLFIGLGLFLILRNIISGKA